MPRAWDAFAQRTAWKIRAPRAAAARSAVFRRSAGYDFGAPAYYCPLTRDMLVSRAALSSRGESRMGLPRAAPKLTRAPRVRLYSRCEGPSGFFDPSKLVPDSWEGLAYSVVHHTTASLQGETFQRVDLMVLVIGLCAVPINSTGDDDSSSNNDKLRELSAQRSPAGFGYHPFATLLARSTSPGTPAMGGSHRSFTRCGSAPNLQRKIWSGVQGVEREGESRVESQMRRMRDLRKSNAVADME
ncbi:hypothetical protein DFH09DRAFT_1099828 [Mycena vulgaris]|nr:hypothetical protein DFH09DRAFT_1099828 [Mycena vulgaris]